MTARLRSVGKTEGRLSCKGIEVWSEKEVKLLNVRLCYIRLVSIHTEELRGKSEAEEPHYTHQRHQSLPWPLPVLSQDSHSPMDQGLHPDYGETRAVFWLTTLTKWVHCPRSWDTWDAGGELLGIRMT